MERLEQSPQDPSRRRFLNLGVRLAAAVPALAFGGMIDRLEVRRIERDKHKSELVEQKLEEQHLRDAAFLGICVVVALPIVLQIEEGIHSLRERRIKKGESKDSLKASSNG